MNNAKYHAISLAMLCWSGSALATCTVTADAPVFADYNVFAVTATSATGSVTVSCSELTSFDISLSSGAGSFANRTMLGPGGSLLYNLYTDASYSQIWGDGSGSSVVVSDSIATIAVYDLYGRIPAGQNLSVGTYSDNITVTVIF